MNTREFRRPLSSAGRSRQIFNRRRNHRGKPILVAGTIAVCLALVFTIGFKIGNTYQTDAVTPGDQLAVTAKANGAAPGGQQPVRE